MKKLSGILFTLLALSASSCFSKTLSDSAGLETLVSQLAHIGPVLAMVMLAISLPIAMAQNDPKAAIAGVSGAIFCCLGPWVLSSILVSDNFKSSDQPFASIESVTLSPQAPSTVALISSSNTSAPRTISSNKALGETATSQILTTLKTSTSSALESLHSFSVQDTPSLRLYAGLITATFCFLAIFGGWYMKTSKKSKNKSKSSKKSMNLAKTTTAH